MLAGLIVFVLVGGLGLAFSMGKSSGNQKDECEGKFGFSSMVHITDGKVSEDDLNLKLCDKIMFMNSDAVTREIGFGQHDEHVSYNGISEKILNEGQMFTITLNQTGKFHWHDHLHDEVEGYFTVTE
jgi:hypothetical protein